MAALIRVGGFVLKEYIYRAMEHVTSADKAYRWLQEQGAYATRREVRETWREVGERTHWQKVLQTWGIERKPPSYWLTPTETKLRAPYQAVIEYDLLGPKGEVIDTKRYGYYTTEVESFADIWENIKEDIKAYMEAAGAVAVDWRPFAYRVKV